MPERPVPRSSRTPLALSPSTSCVRKKEKKPVAPLAVADKVPTESPARTEQERRKSQDLKIPLKNAEAGRPVEGAATDTAAVEILPSALSQLPQWLFLPGGADVVTGVWCLQSRFRQCRRHRRSVRSG